MINYFLDFTRDGQMHSRKKINLGKDLISLQVLEGMEKLKTTSKEFTFKDADELIENRKLYISGANGGVFIIFACTIKSY